MTLVHPQTGWNGKLFVTVHGGTGSFGSGSRKPWDQNFDPVKPMGDLNKYEKAMLAKGYAVAVTKRNAAVSSPGDFSVTLDNGDLWPDQNVGLVPELILDMVRLTGNFLQDRLGQKPTRTYWYGFSGGGMTGSLLNYMSGGNIDSDGTPLVDGFIWDDMAGGLFLPVLMKNGEDVLFPHAAGACSLHQDACDFSPTLSTLFFSTGSRDGRRQDTRVGLPQLPDQQETGGHAFSREGSGQPVPHVRGAGRQPFGGRDSGGR